MKRPMLYAAGFLLLALALLSSLEAQTPRAMWPQPLRKETFEDQLRLAGQTQTPRATQPQQARQQPAQFSPQQLFKRLSPSVFAVEALDEKDAVAGFGSDVAQAQSIIDLGSGLYRTFTLQAPPPGSGAFGLDQFRIQVPVGATRLRVMLTANQDMDFAVRRGQPVELSGSGQVIADYFAETDGGLEAVTISNPPSGSYYIGVANFGPGAATFLIAAQVSTSGTPNVIALTSGGAVSNSIPAPPPAASFLTVTPCLTQYSIQVPSNTSQLNITLSGNQDVDLFVRRSQEIEIVNGRAIYDYSSESISSAESVTVPNPAPGMYYIGVGNLGPGGANFTLTATIPNPTRSAVTVSAASFQQGELAGESLVAAFGTEFATGVATAAQLLLPTSLDGTTVKIRGSSGQEEFAGLLFVSPAQVNYLLPSATRLGIGPAAVTLTSGNGVVSTGTIQLAVVSPFLFSANANGSGTAAANVLRVRGSTQTYELVAEYSAAQSRFLPVPIDLGPDSDQVYLILYGTGVRYRSSLAAVSVSIGGLATPALYAGPQPSFLGLDQINVLIPKSLRGRGEVDVALMVDGKATNTVKINIR